MLFNAKVVDGVVVITPEDRIRWMESVRPGWRPVRSDVRMTGCDAGFLLTVVADILNEKGERIMRDTFTDFLSLETTKESGAAEAFVADMFALAFDSMLVKLGFDLSQEDFVNPVNPVDPDLPKKVLDPKEENTLKTEILKFERSFKRLQDLGQYTNITKDKYMEEMFGKDKSKWNYFGIADELKEVADAIEAKNKKN